MGSRDSHLAPLLLLPRSSALLRKMRQRFAKKSEGKESEEAEGAAKGRKCSVEERVEKPWKKVRLAVEKLCGFAFEDLTSFDKFTSAMYRPTDPASLGVCRALFGLCMTLDVVEERGLGNVDLKWGDPDTCHFPLIHGLIPPPLPWMIVLYAMMWIGAFGIMLGYCFKLACALFVFPYWYLFLLDKSFWNNHSYLFGVVSLLFWGTSANRYFSLDVKFDRENEKSVPFWNYFILKFQFFVLYFLAGLKKSSWEWLEGYAMTNLSRHWVFEPFKIFLSTEQTDYLIVHWFAFIFDLSVGFFMLFDKTRIPAMFFCTAFHLMNSRLFSIGMFPYACLATMPLFCRVDWPRKLCGRVQVKSSEQEFYLQDEENCDSKDNASEGSTERVANSEERQRRLRSSRRQKFVVATLMVHVVLQFFLPYSHFVTKGYNNWVPGLYGYSWDMMVHAWDTALVVIKVRDNENSREFYLDPGVWAPNDRWAKHGDMVRQYAYCIRDNLQKSKTQSTITNNPLSRLSSNLSIYMDIWCSLNGRFQQRLFDPTVDLLNVEWYPFKKISYVMPLLTQFSSYRPELDRIQTEVLSWSNYTDVLFVADYPGLHLENYIGDELENVTLRVLEGEVIYQEEEGPEEEVGWSTARTIGKGGSARIGTGRFHKVKTASPHPACYMYTFANRTKHQLAENGIQESIRVKEAFPILKELGYRLDAIRGALGYITDALLYLIFDIPMIRRVPFN